MSQKSVVDIRWCSDAGEADVLARFFAANITTEYISHSELQGGRAIDVGRWRPNIVDIFRDEIATRVGRERGVIDKASSSFPIAAARDDGRLVGMALVSIFATAPVPYGMLEDIVVDGTVRASGVGKAMLDWITREAEAAGCRRLFLESGHDNDRAHHFFEREGFVPCSVVMMKRLTSAD